MNPVKLWHNNIFNLMSVFFQAGGVNQAVNQGVKADVVISGGDGNPSCNIDDTQLSAIRERARKIVGSGIDVGFEHFPIHRGKLASNITYEMLTKQSVCNALTPKSKTTASDHNKLRNKYKGSSLSKSNAQQRGVIASELPLHMVCQEGYNWETSQFYNGAKSCQDVLNACKARKIPVAMYAINMQPADAQRIITHTSSAPFYMNYANSGPVKCSSGGTVTEAYHKINISTFLPSLKYILRAKEGKGWSAWSLLRSCAANGTVYQSDDLMFNFGARFMIPVYVETDGVLTHRTIIITSAAAASNSSLAPLISNTMAFERFIGGEYAKKILLDAKSNGWQIK